MHRIPVLILMVALTSPALALELVANGGFESDLPPAWQQELSGAATSITRSTGYDGDPDFEVLVEKGTGNGGATLDQTVVIPSVEVDVSVNARIQVASSAGPWAAAGVALHYEDNLGDTLGTTMILRATPDCPWVESDTFRMIQAPDEEWNGYLLDIADELAALTGVDPMAVRRIRFSLVAQVGGDC
jgi:hypothetical protein